MNALLDELAEVPARGSGPPPQAAELDAITKQIAIVEAILDVVFVVLLVFMVFKPGGPRL